jgi:hypothetical protein
VTVKRVAGIAKKLVITAETKAHLCGRVVDATETGEPCRPGSVAGWPFAAPASERVRSTRTGSEARRPGSRNGGWEAKHGDRGQGQG